MSEPKPLAQPYRTGRADRTPLVSPGEIDAHGPDMTATFAADVTLRAAQARLATLDQWLPIDGGPDAPLGQLVSANSTGPLRLGYGAWRDLLLGVQFRNGPNELITAGGRTVKNVAGYDLAKFMVGQHGIFGRIETITTRTYRRPTGALLAHWPLAGGRVGRREVERLRGMLPTPIRPHWTLLSADGFHCGYLGDADAIAFFRAKLVALGPATLEPRSLDEDIAFRAARWQAEGARTFRASVPPGKIDMFLAAANLGRWAADLAFGIVLGTAENAGHVATIRAAASNVGGNVQRFGGAPGEAGDCAVLSTTLAQRSLVERLKLAFDPEGRLAPLPWQAL